MKKKRILTLVHKDLVPPEKPGGVDVENAPWKTEYQVVSTLKRHGHDVRVLGVYDDLGPIKQTIDDFNPHIAFNLLEEFHGEALFDQNVVSYLELKKLPYTGCGPRGLMIARDKALTKKILSFHRLGVPDFQVFPKGSSIKKRKNLAYPLIVKSLTEESSTGISQASIVRDDDKLAERVRFIYDSVGTDAIVERYIEGRELYVGVMGNDRLMCFPIWEMVFRNTPDNFDPIATSKVKWNPDYRKKYGITTRQAKSLTEEECASIHKFCKRVYKLLGLNGYARLDFRLDSSGKPFLIEANPNPDISRYEDFAYSGEKMGLSYIDILNRIINLGLNRKVIDF